MVNSHFTQSDGHNGPAKSGATGNPVFDLVLSAGAIIVHALKSEESLENRQLGDGFFGSYSHYSHVIPDDQKGQGELQHIYYDAKSFNYTF